MQIDRFNTAVSNNLLADGSFENLGGSPDSHTVGGWQLFNNASITPSEVAPQDGSEQLKTFGPFQGSTNASGAFQNVVATPGQQFEGSVWAYAPSADPIKTKQNYTNVTLSFVNAAGAVIGSVNYSPGTNEKNTPIYDGRDTNMIQDQWTQYSVDAVAPAGTAYARLSLFFIQLYHDNGMGGQVGDGGAVFFDNASLVRLSANTPVVIGDYNQDGIVDAADYTVWRDHLGQTFALPNRDPGNTGAIGAGGLQHLEEQFRSVGVWCRRQCRSHGAGAVDDVPDVFLDGVIRLVSSPRAIAIKCGPPTKGQSSAEPTVAWRRRRIAVRTRSGRNGSSQIERRRWVG